MCKGYDLLLAHTAGSTTMSMHVGARTKHALTKHALTKQPLRSIGWVLTKAHEP